MRHNGFNLTELLIVIGIFAVVSAFTVPKVLHSFGTVDKNAKAKEATGWLKMAYSQYRLNKAITATTDASELTPYLNYVSIVTLGNIDGDPGTPTLSCSGATDMCFKLKNSAIARIVSENRFGGTEASRYIFITLDPDGAHSGDADSVFFILYSDGRLTTHFNRKAGELTNFGGTDFDFGQGGADPPWFSWD